MIVICPRVRVGNSEILKWKHLPMTPSCTPCPLATISDNAQMTALHLFTVFTPPISALETAASAVKLQVGFGTFTASFNRLTSPNSN